LACSCLYHILTTTSRGLSGIAVFTFYANDLQMHHTCAVSDFQKCIAELNLDLQRVHEWAAANGLKLNPIKSQVIVISRCRVDFPPPTLLIGSDIIKVVPRLTIGFCALLGHMHRIRRLKLVEGWLCHLLLLCLTLDMGVLCMLVRMLHRNGG
jgi:hypothetical protein